MSRKERRMKEVIVDADDLVCLGKDKLEEVIRCKDCKYYMSLEKFGIDLSTCTNQRAMGEPEPDGYCSYAERGEHVRNPQQKDA